MKTTNVDSFMNQNFKLFPSSMLNSMRTLLEKADDTKLTKIQSFDYKDPSTIFLFSFFLGGIGVDRFMLGQTGAGIAKLLTFGGLGIWALIDLFRIKGITKDSNYQKFVEALN